MDDLIRTAYRECQKGHDDGAPPTTSEVLITTQLHLLLGLRKEIPRELLAEDREGEFWRWVAGREEFRIGSGIIDPVEMVTSLLFQDLPIIDETGGKVSGIVDDLKLDGGRRGTRKSPPKPAQQLPLTLDNATRRRSGSRAEDFLFVTVGTKKARCYKSGEIVVLPEDQG